MNWTKKDLLANPVEHIDLTTYDARPILDAWAKTAYQARNTARAAEIYSMMLADTGCAVILTLAGSLISAGMKKAICQLIVQNNYFAFKRYNIRRLSIQLFNKIS